MRQVVNQRSVRRTSPPLLWSEWVNWSIGARLRPAAAVSLLSHATTPQCQQNSVQEHCGSRTKISQRRKKQRRWYRFKILHKTDCKSSFNTQQTPKIKWDTRRGAGQNVSHKWERKSFQIFFLYFRAAFFLAGSLVKSFARDQFCSKNAGGSGLG